MSRIQTQMFLALRCFHLASSSKGHLRVMKHKQMQSANRCKSRTGERRYQPSDSDIQGGKPSAISVTVRSPTAKPPASHSTAKPPHVRYDWGKALFNMAFLVRVGLIGWD